MALQKPDKPCGGDRCSYNIDVTKDMINCDAGDGSCLSATFLVAEESPFHDKELIAATNSINEILAKIPRKDGIELSLLNTDDGLMLAWVHHSGETSDNDITSKNTPEEIRAALRIR